MNDMSQTLSSRVVSIVRREDINSITSVMEGSKKVDLGIVKNFSSNDQIAAFMKSNSDFYVSWVHLDGGQILPTHKHPIDSMYIMCQGKASLQGDLEDDIVEGDIVLIPKGCLHGFTGKGDSGYWALSVQFELRGIYSQSDAPLVQFKGAELETTTPLLSFEAILERNNSFKRRFEANRVFSALRTLEVAPNAAKLKFLDYFQMLSDHFQRMMLLRSALGDDPLFSKVFREHLRDEFDHDEALRRSRGSTYDEWDGTFDAVCTWFTHQMFSQSNIEQLFLVNYVVEAAADVFYPGIKGVFDSLNVGHFDSHIGLDTAHSELGRALFNDLSVRDYERILQLQTRGWQMNNLLYARLAEIAAHCASRYG